jgi:hypothetical protein
MRSRSISGIPLLRLRFGQSDEGIYEAAAAAECRCMLNKINGIVLEMVLDRVRSLIQLG